MELRKAKTYFKAFTRKKAFDFYIDEVKRDAHKLLGKLAFITVVQPKNGSNIVAFGCNSIS